MRFRVTLDIQVNELSAVARDIEKYSKDGRRVPVAVWKQYDRINKRHKKHEEMVALAAEIREGGGQRARTGHGSELDKTEEERLNVDQNRANRRPKSITTCSQRSGTGCTFGSGRDGEDLQRSVDERCSGRSSEYITTASSPASQPAWGWYEREKLNELCEYHNAMRWCFIFVSSWIMAEYDRL